MLSWKLWKARRRWRLTSSSRNTRFITVPLVWKAGSTSACERKLGWIFVSHWGIQYLTKGTHRSENLLKALYWPWLLDVVFCCDRPSSECSIASEFFCCLWPTNHGPLELLMVWKIGPSVEFGLIVFMDRGSLAYSAVLPFFCRDIAVLRLPFW